MTYGKIIRNNNIISRIETIDKIIGESSFINESTKQFINSLKEFAIRTGGLTARQIASFEKLESSLRNDKESIEKWQQTFKSDAKLRENIVVLAHYYIKTAFFHELSEKILRDASFIPSESQYRSMTSNKYAQKVLESHYSVPIYSVGEMVSIRVNPNTNRYSHTVRNSPAFIMATNSSPVTSAIKGGKKYKILSFGSSSIIEIEERNIKKWTDKGNKKDES